MKTKEVADYFGNEHKASQALGINPSYLTRWKQTVPEIWARRLHDMTDGKLRFDVHEYPRNKWVKARK